MATYEIVSGESFIVRADSEDEALAKFYVSQGYMDAEDYPEFKFDSVEVEAGETQTVAYPVIDFSEEV